MDKRKNSQNTFINCKTFFVVVEEASQKNDLMDHSDLTAIDELAQS